MSPCAARAPGRSTSHGAGVLHGLAGHAAVPQRRRRRQGIEALTQTLKRIDLRFGDDLRVDPLTADYAVVAASFTEVLTDNADHDTPVSGYFTALAERRSGAWVFRNAHWSLRPRRTPARSSLRLEVAVHPLQVARLRSTRKLGRVNTWNSPG